MNITLIIAIIIILALVIGAVVYFLSKKKKKTATQPVIEVKEEPEYVIEKIQLVAVKRLQGSSKFGFETDEEVKARLSSLTRDEFLILNIEDKPWGESQWWEVKTYDEAEERTMYELSMCYAYNYDGTINEERSKVLFREFKKELIK